MPRFSAKTTLRLVEARSAVVDALGMSPDMARDAQREVMWWVYARVNAAQQRRGVLRGAAVGWSGGGYGELLPVDVPKPGRRGVLVLTEATAVSAGTERARYLRLPNASRGLAMPGYSGAGTVVAKGREVTNLAVGDRVAVANARHASVLTSDMAKVYGVPPGVSMQSASTIYLGMISGQGVTASRLAPGEGFVVVGAGPVGLLAQRIAAGIGGRCLAVVARSERARAAAAVGGGSFLTSSDTDSIAQLEAPVVIEATGDPQAISIAVAAAGDRGRVVLLGSPRGLTTSFPLSEIRRKRLEVIGAHVDMLPVQSQRTGIDAERKEGERYMALLGEGAIEVDDLVEEAIDPREAGLFYRRLAKYESSGGYFDWTRLERHERMGRGHLLFPPDLRIRGLDFERRPLPLSKRAPGLWDGLKDPFADAAGHLRIGLLGCGDIGVDNAVAAAAAPNTELTACFDPSRRLAEQVADAHGATVMDSAAELMESKSVDAVLIAVPHYLHAPLAIEAAAHGKHVIVEKPMAHTLEAAREMDAAIRAAGVAFSVCFPMRYDPRVVIAKRLIEAGALGRFTGFHGRLFQEKSASYWVGGYSGRAISDWRASRAKAGGGLLIMNLSHYVDVVRYLASEEADEVQCSALAVDEPAEVEDSLVLSVRFANGAVGSLVGATAVRGTLSEELRLWGRDGHIEIDPTGRFFTLRALPGVRTARWHSFHPPGGAAVRSVYLSRIATALAHGREPEIGLADGLAVQEVVEAAYRASDEATQVSTGLALEGSLVS